MGEDGDIYAPAPFPQLVRVEGLDVFDHAVVSIVLFIDAVRG